MSGSLVWLRGTAAEQARMPLIGLVLTGSGAALCLICLNHPRPPVTPAGSAQPTRMANAEVSIEARWFTDHTDSRDSKVVLSSPCRTSFREALWVKPAEDHSLHMCAQKHTSVTAALMKPRLQSCDCDKPRAADRTAGPILFLTNRGLFPLLILLLQSEG